MLRVNDRIYSYDQTELENHKRNKMSRVTKYRFVPFLLLQTFHLHAYGFSFADRTAENKKCEPVSILPCRKIGYNLTRAVDMYSPIARNIENGRKYIHLLGQTSCSKHAVFLLCTLYSPVCFQDIEENLLPCQSVCYKVKKRCGPLMKKYGIEWPAELDCKTLPEHNTGVCMQPSSFQSAEKGKFNSVVCSLKKSGVNFLENFI